MSYGYSWSEWQYATVGGANVDGTGLADSAQLTTDEILTSGKAACEIAVSATEGNVGACDGNVTVYTAGEGATGWQTIDDDLPIQDHLDVNQDTTRHTVFPVDPAEYGGVKLIVANATGQSVDLTIRYRTAVQGEN